MRFAISAVAAACGALLLGLSFYGQPAVYLRQASEQWDALMDRPTADEAAPDDAGQPGTTAAAPTAPAVDNQAANEQAEQLRQEVARLQHELAVRQQAAVATPTTGSRRRRPWRNRTWLSQRRGRP